MKQKLIFKDILTNGFALGLKNFVPLLLTSILYVVTVWIPYLNVGTTIAMATLPAQLSRGEMINPLSIFDAKYRKFMGEYFLAVSFQMLIVFMGFLFMIIPGVVMGITYMFSALLVVDKGMNPTQSLTASNNMTYGNKVSIFLAMFVISIPLCIPIINFIYIIVYQPIMLSVIGYIYGVLLTDDMPQTTSIEQ